MSSVLLQESATGTPCGLIYLKSTAAVPKHTFEKCKMKIQFKERRSCQCIRGLLHVKMKLHFALNSAKVEGRGFG